MNLPLIPAFMEHGACIGRDPELWFKQGPGTAAKKICAGCPVREECLEYAVRGRIEDGIWGGLGERARRAYHDQWPANDETRTCAASRCGRSFEAPIGSRKEYCSEACIKHEQRVRVDASGAPRVVGVRFRSEWRGLKKWRAEHKPPGGKTRSRQFLTRDEAVAQRQAWESELVPA